MLCLAGLIAMNRHFVTFYSSCFIFESSIALQNRIQHAKYLFFKTKKMKTKQNKQSCNYFLTPKI